MALTDKKFSSIHGLTGNNKNSIKAKFDDGYHEVAITEVEENPVLAALVYQIGQLEEELDYLRTEISANKDKTSMTIGTGANQAMAGNTTIPPITINLASGLSLGLEPNIDTINRRYILGVVVIDSSGKSPVKYRGAITLS